MSPKATIVAIVGAGCIVAAGAGSFVATRLNTVGVGADAATVTTPVTAPQPSAAATTPARISSGSSQVRSSAPSRAPRSVPAQAPARSQAPVVPPVEPTGATVVAPPPVSTEPPITADPIVTPPPTPVVDAAPPVPDPPRRYEELTVKEESVIGIRLDAPISTESAKVEDKVTGRVTRDVTVDGHAAIPAGARIEGSVTAVERGGKFKNQAKLTLRFTTLVLADNTRISIQTDPIVRQADSPGNEATSKIGASAVVGAILGGLVGGKKGAAIGGAAGAAGGTAAVAAGGRNDVTLQAGTPLTVKLLTAVTVLIERVQ